jgi:hypothetical protein
MKKSIHIVLSGISMPCILLLFILCVTQMPAQQNNHQSRDRFTLIVFVFDGFSNKLPEATVQVEHLATGQSLNFRFDSIQKRYLLDSIPSGKIKFTVSKPGFQTEVRASEIADDERIQKFNFYLGRPGMSFTYFDGNRFPFQEDRNKLVVQIQPGNQPAIMQLAQKLGLACKKSSGDMPNMYFLTKSTPFNAKNCTELQEIRKQSYVVSAGPVYKRSVEVEGYFTTRIQVRIRNTISPDTAFAQFKKLGLSYVPAGSDGSYTLQVKSSMGYGINEIMGKLSKLEYIEWINPEIQSINQVPSNH